MTLSVTARRGSLVLAAGLLVTVVPGVASAAPATPSTTAAAVKAGVTLKTGRTAYVAGDRVTLFGHVPAANAPVTVYQRYVNHKDARVIYRGRSNSKGNVVLAGTANYSSAFSLHYGRSSASTTAPVYVRLTQKPAGYYATQGSYRLYRASTGGRVTTVVSPNKTGKTLWFQLQKHSTAGWRTVQTKSFTVRSGSGVAISVKGVAGGYYRIRSYYTGDAANRGNTANWSYARFTR